MTGDSEKARIAHPEAEAAEEVRVARRAIRLLDLTSLNDDDSPEVIDSLCRRASTVAGPVAAVCIYPVFVAQAREALDASGIKVATVVNFPRGSLDTDVVVADTQRALAHGAQEIDVVLPYRAYLSGAKDEALALVERVCEACSTRARVKLILETGAFDDPVAVLEVSRAAIERGVDFLKTSTGKQGTGATLAACAPMLQAIREAREHQSRTVGLKPSGGIATTRDAADYLALADVVMGSDWATPDTLRFGASSLLDRLLDTVR